MGYTTDPSMVRVDFFKASGKWYTTESVKWTGGYLLSDRDNIDAFKESLRNHLGGRLKDMDAVCLFPHHQLEHPLMVKAGEWEEGE